VFPWQKAAMTTLPDVEEVAIEAIAVEGEVVG
jgi:hypothetical protein